MHRSIDGTKQTEGHAVDGSVTGLDLDTTFHLLQNERRRVALRYLLDRRADGDLAVEMRALAEQVAAWEHDTTVAGLDSEQRQRVYISLYQRHLPTLDQHGVVDYDQARGRVELGDGVDALEPYLEQTPETSDHGPTAGAPPPLPESDRSGDGGDGRGHATHLAGAVAFVSLAAAASQFGPEITVSPALLAVVLCGTALLGSGVQRHLTSATDV